MQTNAFMACMLLLTVGIVNAFTSCSRDASEASSPTGPVVTTMDSLVVNRYGRTWFWYAEVNKNGNYFRRMFLDTASARITQETGTLPDNAVIAMETWFGPDQSTVFVREKAGEWRSTSFSPGSPDYRFLVQASCNNCHSRASSTDFTFTRPLLSRALISRRLQIIRCNEDSFTPCDLSVYQGTSE